MENVIDEVNKKVSELVNTDEVVTIEVPEDYLFEGVQDSDDWLNDPEEMKSIMSEEYATE